MSKFYAFTAMQNFKMNFQELPVDVIILILCYCNINDLSKFSQTCKRFKEVVYHHVTWKKIAHNCLFTNQTSENILNRSFKILSPYDKWRIYNNWIHGKYTQREFLKQQTNFMPCLVLERNSVWVAFGHVIKGYARNKCGIASDYGVRSTRNINDGKSDVTHLTKNNSLLLWSQKNEIFVYDTQCNRQVFSRILPAISYQQDIDSLDFTSDIILTARAGIIEIWPFDSNSTHGINLLTRSQHIPGSTESYMTIQVNSEMNCVAVGARKNSTVNVYDIVRGNLVSTHTPKNVNEHAGTLALHWENKGSKLLSCGYHTALCLWDIRVPYSTPSVQWDDPFGAPLYCLSTDDNNTVVCGSQMNARVNAYDLRMNKHIVQMYFLKPSARTSPVYSVDFDSCQLYAATDRMIHVMDFNNAKISKTNTTCRYMSKDYSDWLKNCNVLKVDNPQ